MLTRSAFCHFRENPAAAMLPRPSRLAIRLRPDVTQRQFYDGRALLARVRVDQRRAFPDRAQNRAKVEARSCRHRERAAALAQRSLV
jgi:hypothetical protein